jgi:peptidoglycan/xylan/chitin deacetylase (PgdA/CDA1 family)
MFHSILPALDREIHLRNNSQEELRGVINYLQNIGTIIPLSQWMTDDQPHQFAITFDDGLLNNLLFAAPILAALGAPATYFINTPSLFDQDHIWPELLAQYTRNWHQVIVLNNLEFHRFSFNRWLEKGTQKSLVSHLSTMDKDTLDGSLLSIQQQTNPHELLQAHRVMQEKEIFQLSQMFGVTIGSHGIDHRAMTLLTDHELEFTLKQSKAFLEKCILQPVDALAFPFGDADARVYAMAQSCGYSYLLGVEAKCELPQLTRRFGFYNHETLGTQLRKLSSYK